MKKYIIRILPNPGPKQPVQKRPEISSPISFSHIMHVGFNMDTGEFEGLPEEWQRLLENSNITRQEKEENPDKLIAVSHITHHDLLFITCILVLKILWWIKIYKCGRQVNRRTGWPWPGHAGSNCADRRQKKTSSNSRNRLFLPNSLFNLKINSRFVRLWLSSKRRQHQFRRRWRTATSNFKTRRTHHEHLHHSHRKRLIDTEYMYINNHK